MSESKITREEMIEWFGSEMPIEAVNLIWQADDGNKTLKDVREELRAMSKRRKSRPTLLACPFCGGVTATVMKKYVCCDVCGAQGPFDEEDPQNRWNDRAS